MIYGEFDAVEIEPERENAQRNALHPSTSSPSFSTYSPSSSFHSSASTACHHAYAASSHEEGQDLPISAAREEQALSVSFDPSVASTCAPHKGGEGGELSLRPFTAPGVGEGCSSPENTACSGVGIATGEGQGEGSDSPCCSQRPALCSATSPLISSPTPSCQTALPARSRLDGVQLTEAEGEGEGEEVHSAARLPARAVESEERIEPEQGGERDCSPLPDERRAQLQSRLPFLGRLNLRQASEQPDMVKRSQALVEICRGMMHTDASTSEEGGGGGTSKGLWHSLRLLEPESVKQPPGAAMRNLIASEQVAR